MSDDEQDFTYVHQFERREGFTWRFVGQVLTNGCLADVELERWLHEESREEPRAKPGPYRIISYSRAFPSNPSVTEVTVSRRIVWDVSRAEVPNPFDTWESQERTEVPA